MRRSRDRPLHSTVGFVGFVSFVSIPFDCVGRGIIDYTKATVILFSWLKIEKVVAARSVM